MNKTLKLLVCQPTTQSSHFKIQLHMYSHCIISQSFSRKVEMKTTQFQSNFCLEIEKSFFGLKIYQVLQTDPNFARDNGQYFNNLMDIVSSVSSIFIKGQLISKANCQAVNSSKKRMNEFVFTTMRRVFVRFLEESSARKKCFEII